MLILHPDYTSHLGLYPRSPEETLFVHTMVTPHTPTRDRERDRLERSFELIDGGVFEAEDLTICVAAQRGMRSGANTHLLCGADEAGLPLFHETLNAALAG